MRRYYSFYTWMLFFPALLASALLRAEQAPVQEVLEKLNASPHIVTVERSVKQVVDHEIGLAALKKVRGTWRFDRSERVSGERHSFTWQIVDGFSSAEVMDELLAYVGTLEAVTALFACDGRACGHGSQWANRVFRNRLLYGQSDMQRYRVFALQGEPGHRLVIYSSARSEDRQYLHVELLRLTASAPPEIIPLP